MVNQTYTLKNVQSDCKISAVFSPDSQNGMENIISKLPEVPAGNPPTDDQKTSILEAKLQYEAMPAKEKKAVSETAKKELCDAIAQLPQVKTAVEGTLTVADQNLLLENMTSEDVEKLSQD
ncbi:leucine-rich repeat domain-containing protein, partial [Intestinibacillus massiliensis]|nr:leucine-rich repeat domain-containing protein [Intestinibacillus massiliensis]